MPLPWSGNLAAFGGVYTQADCRLVFFWTARLTLAADGVSVSGRISWHRGTGPVAASDYIGQHVAYCGDEIVQGEFAAAAGPSALPQISLRGTALAPADAPLGLDEYIFAVAADGSTVTVQSKGGQMPGERCACSLLRAQGSRAPLLPPSSPPLTLPTDPFTVQRGPIKWWGCALRRMR